jgi:glycosyltransferase involved in cell wall biosynthesis
MRDQLELMAADDERIVFRSRSDGAQLADVIPRHDAVIVPSIWACWPLAAVRALAHNRPVLATPVGGLVELVEEGVIDAPRHRILGSQWLPGEPETSPKSAMELSLEADGII